MNHINVAVNSSIVTLHQRGWSQRRIARELGIDRETVGRHLRLEAKPANVPAGPPGSNPAKLPAGSDEPNPAKVPAGDCGRRSLCFSQRELIETKLAGGLSAQRIYQDLRDEVNFTGAYDAVKRFVRSLARANPHRFMPLHRATTFWRDWNNPLKQRCC